MALEHYRIKKRPILLSDGSLYKGSPAIKMIREHLESRDVEPGHILFEGISQTTFESCQRSLNLIRNRNAKGGIIVCTSPYHQRRTRMIMDYLGYENFKIAKMNTSEVYRAGSIGQRMRNMKLILREYVAIVKFLILRK
jgi:uncharacterized SAM-binding protein YcdF (DUF218 family)